MNSRRNGGLASALFSGVQLRVLSLFFGHPERAYQFLEVVKQLGSGRGAVQRELQKLAHAGILELAISGNSKRYQANRQSPIFEELYSLIQKTTGLVEPLARSLKTIADKIDVAFVYGSMAKGDETSKSDIDVMVIANGVAYSEIYKVLQPAERILSRPINPTLMNRGEWQRKLREKNNFVKKIAQRPKMFIIGSEDELA